MELVKSSVKLFIVNIINTIALFVGLTWFARAIGAEQMGVFFLFWAVVGLLGIGFDFGLLTALEKRISEKKAPEGVLATVILLKAILLGIAFILLIGIREPLTRYLGADLVPLLILTLFIEQAGRIFEHSLRGEIRAGDTAVLVLSQRIVFVVVGMVFVIGGNETAFSLIYGQISGFFLAFIWGWYKVETPLGSPSLEHAYSLIQFSKYSFLIDSGGYLYNWTDILVIGLLLSQAAVGAYEMAWRVAAVIMLVSNAIHTTLFPQISEWNSMGSTDLIEWAIEKSMIPALFFVFPAAVGIVFLAHDVLELLFGPEFAVATAALIVLMGGKIIQAPHVILERTLSALDHPALSARAMMLSMGLNILLNVVLIGAFGLVGAAFATVLASLVNLLFHIHYLSRYLHLSIPYRSLAWCGLSALCMGGVLAASTRVVVITLPTLFALIFMSGIIYFTLVFSSGRMRNLVVDGLRLVS